MPLELGNIASIIMSSGFWSDETGDYREDFVVFEEDGVLRLYDDLPDDMYVGSVLAPPRNLPPSRSECVVVSDSPVGLTSDEKGIVKVVVGSSPHRGKEWDTVTLGKLSYRTLCMRVKVIAMANSAAPIVSVYSRGDPCCYDTLADAMKDDTASILPPVTALGDEILLECRVSSYAEHRLFTEVREPKDLYWLEFISENNPPKTKIAELKIYRRIEFSSDEFFCDV